MVGFAIWIVGLVLTIKAALEIWRIHAPIERRLIAIILIVLTSWIGLLFYYFYGKARMPRRHIPEGIWPTPGIGGKAA